ncbi:HNH endonuclease signature motif containing protein [Verminephrobacter eiseniae]|uniref:HNH endonuclease signature motif containing protein n=1 Tax=Verminephrobacter eiseniae TaxID=364317 RepID=UPI0022381377|nr:HNH endonuclease signature motif containing protein [Verminephrobacter eiseniae]MCW5235063.1 HNH endonuclease [Verminephrobacter eiseniae]
MKYPKEFLNHVKAITNKRAKIVIDHILEHGSITTEDLETTYGYSHPPRAARDVREAGILLETFKTNSKSGKSIAGYKFGDITKLQLNRVDGRISFPKEFKKKLYESGKGRCFVCHGGFEKRYLQVDHRVPYEVGGDTTATRDIEDFMLLCSSCNRAKSWSCEHCDNWQKDKKPTLCMLCYWGNPTNYNHIAIKEIRRLDLHWTSDEVKYYDAVRLIAEQNKMELPDFVKAVIADKTKKQ